MKVISRIFFAAMVCAAFFSCGEGARPPGNGELRSVHLSSEFRAFFDTAARESVSTMRRNGIPGLSIAIVDSHGPLWEDGFGFADDAGSVRVTPDTRFSIQSMSKTFTGMAVLAAEQDGIVDLDAPITAYVPDFTVHSVYETFPERKMTLRLLMTHLAGFTHEAPVGNNFTPGTPSFDEHVASIKATWLRYPVGRKESYSNLGVDLAGYIVQVVRERPFAEVMRDTVFVPFGMDRTTDGDAEILADRRRAVGHTEGMASVPIITPMLASGGVWSTAHDIGHFLSLMLQEGENGGPLARSTFAQMRTTANGGSFGIGVAYGRMKNGDLYLNHGGGGFGFRSIMEWYPTLGIGIVVLTNSAAQGSPHVELAHRLVAQMQAGGLVTSRFTLVSEPVCAIDIRGGYDNGEYFAAHADQAAWKNDWKRYLGTYALSLNGEPLWWAGLAHTAGLPRAAFVKVTRSEGGIALDGSMIIEAEPGLFFTTEGEVLDFRGPVPTWRNIPLTRR